MKKSRYNFIWEIENEKKIAFNSATCSLAEVDNKFIDMLEKIESVNLKDLNNDELELIKNMKDGGYILDKDIDEIKDLKFKNYSGKFGGKTLGLTIAPTINCNFKCIYCYETPKANKMTIETQDKLIQFASKYVNTIEHMGITWYGGEPLLCTDVIYRLSEKLMELCEKNNVEYSAYMVSNGYLIDEKVVENLKKYKVSGVQITVDGPEHIHNKRRVLRSGKNDNFNKIIKSIGILDKNDINVSIRINIDKDNVEYVKELCDILKEQEFKNIDINFGQVTPYTEACKSVSSSCYNTEEFSEIVLKLQDILNENGFSALSGAFYPGIKGNYCCADQINSYVVDPEGNLYKCWNEIGEENKSVGNIFKLDENISAKFLSNQLKYMTWTPFDSKECLECGLLPICMGGCPYSRHNKSTMSCERWKYNLENIIKKTYNNNKKYPKEFEKAFN